jgi:tryptophan halogenase
MKVLVVGGGTAGLVAATIIKSKLDVEVDIVRSSDIGIVGVGEGSTEQFKDYLEMINVDLYDFIAATDSTLKLGIVFNNWNKDRSFMHTVGEEWSKCAGQYPYIYGHQIAYGSHVLHDGNTWNGAVNRWFLNRKEEWPANQFHFNTFKLNEYLTKVAEFFGIKIFEDEIKEVVIKDSGEIHKVKGEKRDYNYDFYVDATGFKRVLMTPLGAKWRSFSEYMKMNSAITFQLPNDVDNFPMYTMAQGMDAGWMFSLPTWDHFGNGYIYDKNYINEDEAKAEVEKLLGHEIKVGKKFSFDPGCLEEGWIKNCMAVGLASAFVEPLEATSIGSTIQQSFLLIHRLANYNEESIKSYNKSFTSMMDNIRDFITLHYITNRRDTPFWRDVAEMPLPESLAENLKKWKHRLPISEDFFGETEYIMFKDSNFIVLMEGLDLFDVPSIRKEFLTQTKEVRDDASRSVENRQRFLETVSFMKHKDFIYLIRELFA